MKITFGLILGLTIGCSGGNSYISKSDTETDTGLTDTGADSDEDTDSGDDTDPVDTDSAEDSGDTGTGEPEICKNDYHPVHLSGWTKTFEATYEGGSGTATEEALPETSWHGRDVYSYRDTMSVMVDNILGMPEEKGWSNTMFISCSEEDGMYLNGWTGTITNDGFDLATFQNYDSDVETDFGTGHLYLPYEFAVGAIGSWNNSYTLIVTKTDPTSGAQTNTRAVTSIHNEVGFVPYSLFDGSSAEAYKIVYEMTITDDLGQAENNYVEQYWVRGLGMVQEDFLDNDGAILLSKVLSSYSGLTIIE